MHLTFDLSHCLFTSEIWRVVFSSEVGCQYKSNTHPSAEAWFYCYDFVSCTGRKTGFKSFPSCGGGRRQWRGARSGLVNYSTPRRRYYEQRTSKQKQQTFHDLKMIFFFISSNKASDCSRQRLLLLPLGTVSLLINYKCVQGG